MTTHQNQQPAGRSRRAIFALATGLCAALAVSAGSATAGDNFSVVPTSISAAAHVYEEVASGVAFTVTVYVPAIKPVAVAVV